MSKAQIEAAIAAVNLSLTRGQVKKIASSVVGVVGDRLARGESFSIPGVGVLHVAQCRERNGFNPVMRAVVEIPAHRVIRFRASALMKSRLNPCESDLPGGLGAGGGDGDV